MKNNAGLLYRDPHGIRKFSDILFTGIFGRISSPDFVI